MKSKTLVCFVVTAVMLGWQARAQTNVTPVIPANLIGAPGNLRDVGGVLYNIDHSAFWENLQGAVLNVSTNGIALSTFTTEPVYEASTRSIESHNYLGQVTSSRIVPTTVQVGTKEVPGRKIIIRNYPAELYPAVGQKISFRAMRIGTSIYNGDTLELWDSGTKPTQDELNKLKDEADERQKAKAYADAKKKANEVRTGVVTNMAGLVQDIRVVNGQAYDVTTSKEWVSITIPTGTGLLNANQIQFTGTVHQIDINFALRVASVVRQNDYETVVIHNFPYDPKYFYNVSPTSRSSFQSSFPLIQTRLPLKLRVFPLSHPRTNWNALGEMKITPARPDFDFGLQEGAQIELDDQDYAAAEKADAAKTAVQAKVLKSNQDLADKGDEYGLLRMGERYRDGDGVPKDLAKAKDYLIKATTAGSPAAADELSKLNSASANSPAAQ